MQDESTIYGKLNEAWKTTCKIVLHGEVGKLKDFEPWLMKGIELMNTPETPLWKNVKDVKGENVAVFGNLTTKAVKFVRWSNFSNVKTEPLTIDEIKDVDSILEAWRERWYYLAEVVLGESSYVNNSDGVFNSHYVSHSYGVNDSKFVAYGLWVRNGGTYVFGSGGGPAFKFTIRSFYGGNLTRTLETYYAADVADIYYSFGVYSSADIMFSFEVTGKRHVIGNLGLPKEKYNSIKKVLLEQIRDELTHKKALPSLFDLIVESKYIPHVEGKATAEEPPFDLSPIEEGFKRTSKILLSEEMELKKMETYLSRGRSMKTEEVKSLLGNPIKFYHIMFYAHYPSLKNRLLSLRELKGVELPALTEGELFSFERIKATIGKVAVICQEIQFVGSFGGNINYKDVPIAAGVVNAYKTFDVTAGKHQAYNYLACPHSQYTYGSFFIVNSQIVINSDIGDYLTRVHGCYQCNRSSDVHFSIHIDGSSEVMFSQHLKGARYTIGNLQLNADKYKEIKAALLKQIVDELKSKGKLHFDVDSFGV